LKTIALQKKLQKLLYLIIVLFETL